MDWSQVPQAAHRNTSTNMTGSSTVYLTTNFVTSAALLLAVTLRILLWAQTMKNPLPPGPSGAPIVGNLFQLPKTKPWIVYDNWAKIYGDVFYFRVFRRHFVVLNSMSCALDLLEKRSVLYSDRPVFVMCGELVGRNNSVLFSHYGETLRTYRRLLHAVLNSTAAQKYRPFQQIEVHKFLFRLLDSPGNLRSSIRRYAGTVVLRIAYGHIVRSDNDRYVQLAEELAHITTEAIQPGRWLVDSFPWLRYVPEWFPGASFQIWARNACIRSNEIIYQPIREVKESLVAGTALSSFTAQFLEKMPEAERDIMHAASSFYAARADTTASILATFFLMMALHPEIQSKARAELDKVVGVKRLPDIQDQHELPYIEALIKEVYRFHPVAPLVLHSPLDDDIYKGYLIPKGSSVFVNIWAILHDETVFSDAHLFKPESFFIHEPGDEAPLDPRTVIFGFGRRLCPGQHLGNTSVFMGISNALATLCIEKEVDEYGVEIEPIVDFTTGHTSHPLPFHCRITARSVEAAHLLEAAAATDGNEL